jgi:aryl-alcohol dehydrogenase-like predicted oxidoreductase
MMDNFSRLAIGTAQFGMSYGIANKSGQVGLEDAKSIIDLASLSKVNTLDTAIAYGDSEACLGKIGIEKFNVVTKIPNLPSSVDSLRSWVDVQIKGSIKRLGSKKLSGVLLHNPNQLLDSRGPELFGALQAARESGLVDKIGVSVYSPDDLKELLKKYSFDLVQVPFNIIDRRILTSGMLDRMKELEIEVHTRSVFLQGLLAFSRSSIPRQFHKWDYLWSAWHRWLVDNNKCPISSCLNFLMSFSEIDRIIVGVDSLEQFSQILRALEKEEDFDFPDIICEDENLINPAKWERL